MKTYYTLVDFTVSMLLFITVALGENVRIISYHALPILVEQNNLGLRIAHAQVGVARGQLEQSGRLANPELSIALGGNREFDEGGVAIGFSQQFPITNRLSLEKGVSQTLLKASELEIEVVRRELLRDTRQRYSALYYLRQKSLVLKEQQKNLEELGRFIDQAVSQAQLSSLDSTKIKIETLRFQTELNEIEASITKESHSLKLLLGINPAAEVALAASIPPAHIIEKGTTYKAHPSYLIGALMLDAAEQGIDLAVANRYADVAVEVIAGLEQVQDAPVGARSEQTLNFGVSIPLPLWNRNEGAINAAQAKKEVSSQSLQNLSRKMSSEAASLKAQYIVWQETADSIQNEIIPEVQGQVAELKEAYLKGQSELNSVFRAQEQLSSLRINYLDAMQQAYDFNIQLQFYTQ